MIFQYKFLKAKYNLYFSVEELEKWEKYENKIKCIPLELTTENQ